MISNSDKPWEEQLSVKLHKVKIEYRNSKIEYYDTEMNIAIQIAADLVAIQIAADLVAIAHGMRKWVPDLAGAGLCSFDLPFIGLYRFQPSLARPKNWLQS